MIINENQITDLRTIEYAKKVYLKIKDIGMQKEEFILNMNFSKFNRNLEDTILKIIINQNVKISDNSLASFYKENNIPTIKLNFTLIDLFNYRKTHTSKEYEEYGTYLYKQLENKSYNDHFLIEMRKNVFNNDTTFSAFLHEFQHFIYDYLKIKRKKISLDDYKKYRNDPNENNSFVLENIYAIIKSFPEYIKKIKDENNEISDNEILSKYMNFILNNNEKLSQLKYLDTSKISRYLNRIYKVLYYLYIDQNRSKGEKELNKLQNETRTEK